MLYYDFFYIFFRKSFFDGFNMGNVGFLENILIILFNFVGREVR